MLISLAHSPRQLQLDPIVHSTEPSHSAPKGRTAGEGELLGVVLTVGLTLAELLGDGVGDTSLELTQVTCVAASQDTTSPIFVGVWPLARNTSLEAVQSTTSHTSVPPPTLKQRLVKESEKKCELT